MIYIGLAVAVACQVLMLCLVLLIFFRARRVYNEAKANFLNFINSPGDNQPSPLAQTTEIIADTFSRSLVAKAKAIFMNQASIAKRQENIIEGEAAQEAIAGMGSIGTLLTQVPMVQKSLKKNPLLGLALARLLGSSTFAGSTKTEQPGNGHNIQFKGKI